MAVELDPTVLPVMHKKARPVRHNLAVRVLGSLFLGFAAWNEREIDAGVDVIDQVMRRWPLRERRHRNTPPS